MSFIDIITLIEKSVEYHSTLKTQRFRWVFVFVALSFLLFYFSLENIAYASLCMLGFVFFWYFFLLPWEKYYFKKLKNTYDDFEIDKLKTLLNKHSVFISYSAKIKKHIASIDFHQYLDNIEDIDKSISFLNDQYLLPREKILYLFAKARMYLHFDNIKRLNETLKELKPLNISSDLLLDYNIIEAEYLSRSGYQNQAKTLLLKTIEDNPKSKLITIYNNLANFEERACNFTQALHYYEKAFDLLKQKPKAVYFNTVLHNLIILNFQQNNIEDANNWLHTYSSLVNKYKIDEYINFLNTKVIVARQTTDRELLYNTYQEMDNAIKIQQDSEQNKLIFFISKLRMSYNDNIEYEKNLFEAQNLFDNIKNLAFPSSYYLTKEIYFILNDLSRNSIIHPDDDFLMQVEKFILEQSKLIKNYRKKIPDWAVNAHFFWLQELNNIQRLMPPKIYKKDFFVNFFGQIEELINFASEYEVPYLEIKAHLIYCDEYLGYLQNYGKKIEVDFCISTKKHLHLASRLLDNCLHNSIFFEFLIPIGIYFFKIENNTKKALEYKEVFESKKISITHFAKWQRNYYSELLKLSYIN